MATTTATLSITSSDLTPGQALNISATTSINQTVTSTGMEIVDMGAGTITESSGADALADVLGTTDTANWVYICNNATNAAHYLKVGIHDMVIGNLGSGEWMWMPWNKGDADAELNIEAEPSGQTIPYEYAIFQSTKVLPAKT